MKKNQYGTNRQVSLHYYFFATVNDDMIRLTRDETKEICQNNEILPCY